jgi:hypothetical protein
LLQAVRLEKFVVQILSDEPLSFLFKITLLHLKISQFALVLVLKVFDLLFERLSLGVDGLQRLLPCFERSLRFFVEPEDEQTVRIG